MGDWTDSSDEESSKALQRSLDAGCNFFDTAWAYGKGRSDALLGSLIQNNPKKKIYAASKIPPMNWKWPAKAEYAYGDVFPIDHVIKHAKLINKALGRTADLLQFHVWDDSWAKNKEFAETVKELKDKKLTRAFGISLNTWDSKNGIDAIKTGLIDTVQVVYNVFEQAPEDELFKACKEFDTGVIARVPLDEGSLGGKFTDKTTFPSNDWRAGYFTKERLTETLNRVEELKKTKPKSMTLPEMALRFVLSNQQVSTAIVGMRKEAHVDENLSVSDGKLLDFELMLKLHKHRWNRNRKNVV